MELNSFHRLEFFDFCNRLTRRADMALIDLPYETTDAGWDTFIPVKPMWDALYSAVKPDGAIVLTAAQRFIGMLIVSNHKDFRYKWVWDKGVRTGHLNAKKQPLRQHEDILVFYRERGVYNPQMTPGEPYVRTPSHVAPTVYMGKARVTTVNKGERYPTDILRFSNPNGKKIHPTQKPVPLFEYLIRTYTNPGDLVIDPCAGSGTTAIAAANTGRAFIVSDNGRRDTDKRWWSDIAKERFERETHE